MKSILRPVVFSALLVTLAAAEPRLNQIQAIGSHNSYHLAPPAAVMAVIGKFSDEAPEAWNYSHPPLAKQLGEQGLRQLELDVYADTVGGKFADPLGVKLAKLTGAKLLPFDPTGALKKPGFKILHVPDIDCWSNSPTLDGALQELVKWSRGQPGHLPVMVLIECEDEAHPPLPTKPETFSRERLLELDAAILKALPREMLLLPDDVRGDLPTLREAVVTRGWPEISKIRGKFLFCLDNGGAIRDRYLEENPSLEKRVLFLHAPTPDHPAAAWFKLNDPQRDFAEIQRLVKQGFLVRTRADDRMTNPAMRDRAFASGAQWISTDHFSATEELADRVAFPGGAMVRPNSLVGAGPVSP